ncbi:ABC transporter permease [Hungatella hathewayi]
MLRYFLKRLLWMIPTILGVAILVFTLMYFTPGDPARIALGENATEEQIDAWREEYGLNESFIGQMANYFESIVLHFDFGTSYLNRSDVKSQLVERYPRTFTLAVATIIIAVCLGVPLGVMAAINQNTLGDRLCMLLALIGVSMPNFWLALMLILLFSVRLGLLPAMGIGTLAHYILPAISGALGGVAGLARQSRSSMLEVIRSDFITTARSKGVSEGRVILKHALQNALIPVLTVIGQQFAGLIGGSLILETIFSIPGIGSYIITAVNNRDYPIVRSGCLVMAVTFSLIMLLVDILYAVADPRIRAQYTQKGKTRRAK